VRKIDERAAARNSNTTSDVLYLIDCLANFAVAGADLHVAVERKMALAFGHPMTAAQSREAHRSHLVGCACRTRQRLDELVARRKAKAATPGSSRALAKLDKPTLVQAEMDRLDIKLSTGRRRPAQGITARSPLVPLTARRPPLVGRLLADASQD